MNCLSLLILFIGFELRQAQILDHCKIVVASNTDAGDSQQVSAAVPLPGCIYGEIEWNHPQGTLLFTNSLPGQNYELCLESDWATALSGVTELTNGLHVPLPVPTTGRPTCTLASQGRASLLLYAPRKVNGQSVYMSSINYLVLDASMVHGSLTPHP
ncbi:hypothetical protein BgiMline_011644 [Biomphalaria glabrata]|uniref:Uncharacterized protein LOC106065651 n=1 Tax=Biomphalaria glabrata TaxID=6526 RepID=A0A9U8EAG6_BIOGL|nr:uncharacterized protein LOC106065651 [Biomphalaria glabrata]KAI8733170.1 hypothetical protein BgiMline_029115 [Biomphalaria glabrata]